MYKRKEYHMKNVIEVKKYYPGNYGAPGKKRKQKLLPTSEAMQRLNERERAAKLRRLILMNFEAGDWHVTLRYTNRERPTAEEAKQNLRDFIRKMRNIHKKAGLEFMYIAVTEIGKSGGAHHHIIIKNYPDVMEAVKKQWSQHGSTFWADLYEEDDGFQHLADYLVKKESKEKVPGLSYTRSKNLEEPKAEITQITAKTWSEVPKAPKGYYIVKDSIVNGVNPITGMPFQRYIMKKIQSNERQKSSSGKSAHVWPLETVGGGV